MIKNLNNIFNKTFYNDVRLRIMAGSLGALMVITGGAWVLVQPRPAAAFGCANCATEWTQLFNNFELVASYGEQAKAVAEAVKNNITTYNQYITMMQNLKNLPQEMLQETLKPYKDQKEALANLYNAVDGARKAAQNTTYLLESRATERRALGVDMKTYWTRELQLAETRGGAYKDRYTQDLKAISNLREKAKAVEILSAQTGQVKGNVEGLALLNQQSTQIVSTLTDMHAQGLQASAQKAMSQEDNQKALDAQNQILAAEDAEIERRRARNATLEMRLKNPWEMTPQAATRR